MIYKKTVILPNKQYKGNCDAELIVEAMKRVNEYNTAIIMSGDGDYICLLEYLEEMNKCCIIGSPNRKTTSKLYSKYIKEHKIFFLNEIQKKIKRQ